MDKISYNLLKLILIDLFCLQKSTKLSHRAYFLQNTIRGNYILHIQMHIINKNCYQKFMNPALDPVSLSYSQSSPQSAASNPTPSANTCFTIQGNIGCGKSTFLEILRSRMPQAVWIEQPVKDWQDLGGKGINMLQRYYTEPKRWGFTFQIYAIFTRIKKMQQACLRHPTKIKISQRSILADKYVFAQLMKQLGYMQYCEYQVYKQLFQNFAKSTNINETKIIYLRCSPETCYQRTKARMRPEQAEIPLEYLKMIHEKHEKWFEAYDKSKVLVIDTDNDFKHDGKLVDGFMERLREFLESEKKGLAQEKEGKEIEDQKEAEKLAEI